LASTGRARRRETRSCDWTLAHGVHSEEPLWRQQAGRAGERRVLAPGPWRAGRVPRSPFGVNRPGAQARGAFLRQVHGAHSEEPLWRQRAGCAGKTRVLAAGPWRTGRVPRSPFGISGPGAQARRRVANTIYIYLHSLSLSLSQSQQKTKQNKTKQNKTTYIYIYIGDFAK